MIDDLYSARILTLAANLPHAGRLPQPDGTGERTAKLCGSRATVDVTLDDQARVAGFALDLTNGGPDDGDADFKEYA